jgi:hypothetical protein
MSVIAAPVLLNIRYPSGAGEVAVNDPTIWYDFIVGNVIAVGCAAGRVARLPPFPF